jgi:hypothetical protein
METIKIRADVNEIGDRKLIQKIKMSCFSLKITNLTNTDFFLNEEDLNRQM